MGDLRSELDSYKGTKKPYKILVFIVSVLILVLLGYVYFPKQKQGTLEYVTSKASKGDLSVVVSASGNIKPTNSVDIGIEVSGTIKEIFVDFNDEVKVGQILAKIDTTKLDAQVESSKAALAIAKASLAESEVNEKNKKLIFDRTQSMFNNSNGKYPSKNELDMARFEYEASVSALDGAKARVLQSESNLKNDRENLQKASVRSSIDGIVLNREVEIGQTLAASMQAPKLFTLAKDLTNMDLVINIDEADVAGIKDGLDVTFSVDAYPSKEFRGKIKQVRLNPVTTNGVVTYEAVASVDNSELLLKPGMTANAKIVTKHLKEQLLIPSSALRFTPKTQNQTSKPTLGAPSYRPQASGLKEKKSQDGVSTVYILENNTPKAIKVRVLDSDSKQTSVSSDELRIDDEVIISQKSTNAK